MDGIPVGLLSADLVEAVGCLADHADTLREYKVRLFHLCVGLVPSQMDWTLFNIIRVAFLTEKECGHLLKQFPSFIYVSPNSTSAEIKAHLQCAGIPELHTDRLPDLNYFMYIAGMMGEFVGQGGLRGIGDWCGEMSGRFFNLDPSIRSTIDALFRQVTGAECALHASFALVPVKPLPLSLKKPLPLDPDMPSSHPFIPQLKLPSEFELPFRHHKEAILDHLVPSLNDRHSRHLADAASYKDQPVYAPVVHLVNASGTGKTRSVIELGKLTNVLYFKFANDYALKRSGVGQVILDQLESGQMWYGRHRLSHTLTLHCITQRLIYACSLVDRLGELSGCIFVDAVFDAYMQHLVGLKPFRALKNLDFKSQVEVVLLSGLGMECPLRQAEKVQFDSGKHERYLSCDDVSMPWQYAIDVASDGTCTWSPGLHLSLMTSTNLAWLSGRAKRLREAHHHNSEEGDGNKSGNDSVDKLPDLLIVYDEIHYMMKAFREGAVVPTGPYRREIETFSVFQGMFRFIKVYWKFLLITVSTAAKTSHFDRPLDDPSVSRGHFFKVHEPIILKYTMDAVCKGSFVEWCEDDWNKFVRSVVRARHIISCGRPLWSAAFMNLSTVDLLTTTHSYHCLIHEHYLSVCFKKLGANVCYYRLCFTQKIGDNEAMAMLGLAVALHKNPVDLDHAEMVRVGPMTLVEFDAEMRSDRYDYVAQGIMCSEGTFNGCAAVALMTHFDEVMEWLYKWSEANHQYDYCDNVSISWLDLVDVIDRMCVLYALRNAPPPSRPRYRHDDGRTISEFIFEPTPFESFLEVWVGPEITGKYMEMAPGLRGSRVAFSHFYYMGGWCVGKGIYDVMANALARGAAIIPRKEDKDDHVNMLIPLILSNGKLSFVYWITRLGADEHPAEVDVQLSSPHYRFPRSLHPGRPYAYIYRTIKKAKRLDCKLIGTMSPLDGDMTETDITCNRAARECDSEYDSDSNDDDSEYDSSDDDYDYEDHDPCLSMLGPAVHVKSHYMPVLIDALSSSRYPRDLVENNLTVRRTWLVPSQSDLVTMKHDDE